MKVTYQRELDGNYMILSPEEEYTEEPLCVRMLKEQTMSGMLKLRIVEIDNIRKYCYNITSKKSLTDYCENSNLGKDVIQIILSGLLETICDSMQFFLNENDFIIHPDFLYLDSQTRHIYLSYVSGYHKDIMKQISELLQYCLSHIDYENKASVMYLYYLHKEITVSDLSILDLQKLVQEGYQEDNTEEYPKVNTDGKIEQDKKEFDTNGYQNYRKASDGSTKLLTYIISHPLFGFACSLCLSVILFLILWLLGWFQTPFGKPVLGRIYIYIIIVLLLNVAMIVGIIYQQKVVKRKPYVVFYENTKPINHQYVGKTEIAEGRNDINYVAEATYYESNCLDEDKEKLVEEKKTCILNPQEKTIYYLKADQGNKYPDIIFSEFPFYIGKKKNEVDFFLDEDAISRYHAKITRNQEIYYVTDLNSLNGTFINGKLLNVNETCPLYIGDKVCFANISYTFSRLL